MPNLLYCFYMYMYTYRNLPSCTADLLHFEENPLCCRPMVNTALNYILCQDSFSVQFKLACMQV